MAKVNVDQNGRDIVKPICGIIMPISAMPPNYDAAHWIDVRKIIDIAVEKAGMTPQIVSDSFEGDVIQRRIIINLYDNPVVICDVSGSNANVMFELGMRITFKLPVIIITDDFSTIPFDTKVIQHLLYPRDLHIHQTNDFIEKLSERIKRLYEQKTSGLFKSFIEEFGTFEVLEPTKKVVESDQLILDKLEMLEKSLRNLSVRNDTKLQLENVVINRQIHGKRGAVDIILERNLNKEDLGKLVNYFSSQDKTIVFNVEQSVSGTKLTLVTNGSADDQRKTIDDAINKMPHDIRMNISNIRFN